MVWGKAGSTTLGTAALPLTLTGINTSKFNTVLIHTLDGGSTSAPRISITDNGTGTKHAGRTSKNGAADATQTSRQDWVSNATENASNQFQVGCICNISGEETLGMSFCCDESVAGAGNDPERRENVGKHSDTTQFTRIDIVSSTTNNFASSSNISVLGSDLTPSAGRPTNVQAGSRFEETDTRKIYHYSEATLTFSDDFSSSPNGWTLNSIGSGQSISGGALISSVSPSNGYKAFAIGDPTKFVLDLDWEFNGGDTPVVILSSDTSGYGDPSEGNRRLIIMGSSNNNGDLRFSNRWWKTGDSAKDEVNSSLVAGGTSGSTGVKYFWRFVKSGTSLSFKRYLTDSDRTSGANLQQETTATDTAPSGLVTYSYIEVSGYGSSGTNKLYDFKFYSGVSSV